jgi:heat shock protein HtpX
MAVHGYITHAAHNRRYTALLVLGYILAFEIIGAFALTLPLLNYDYEHTILSNPVGYAIRYALPIAVLAALVFWRTYRGHAKAVTKALGVRIVLRRDEPRFVQIAEEQCTALGVRLPRFGIIEANEPNAVTVGEGPTRGLIAVTRGLLDQLDDDELAAVLAHEASHIRQGDTRLLAANHALMRTAVMLQMNNPLRIENWRQFVLVVLVPPMLLLLLFASAATTFSLRLSRAARRGLKLGRDHVADGEAIRVTHFPEALLSAIEKIGGRGAFEGSDRVEGMLFDGRADHEGGSHPAIRDRLEAIRTLGAELMNPARRRRDSRMAAPPAFGRRPRTVWTAYPLDASGRPLEQPRPPARDTLLLYFTDRELYRQWHNASAAWTEGQLNQRNWLGLTPKLMIALAVSCAAMLFLYWPKDGNPSRLMTMLNPTRMVDLARQTHSTFCIGPSYPDGKCPETSAPFGKIVAPPAQIASNGNAAASKVVHDDASGAEDGGRPSNTITLMMFIFMLVGLFRPSWIRRLMGFLDPLKIDRDKWRSTASENVEDKTEENRQTEWHTPPPRPQSRPLRGPVFGRRNA